MMRRVLGCAAMLLRDDGMLFLHIDYRTHPYLRLMLDEIFGESNFLNEIIWVYQSGGRILKYFSRKHDVILFYRKSREIRFQCRRDHGHAGGAAIAITCAATWIPTAASTAPSAANGRIYTYYDDDPVAPSDVWNDLSTSAAARPRAHRLRHPEASVAAGAHRQMRFPRGRCW